MYFESYPVLRGKSGDEVLQQALEHGIQGGHDVAFLLDESADVVSVEVHDVFVGICSEARYVPSVYFSDGVTVSDVHSRQRWRRWWR